jgi:hypothetical protein
LTGNATRDQVRKLLFESFQGDKSAGVGGSADKKTIGQVVEEIENDIFGKREKLNDMFLCIEECKDAKSK